MSRLVSLIDAYKDQHGQPSDSSVARAIGIKPQTLSSWRYRGIKEPPDRSALRKLAELIGDDYETVVLRAALLDAGWIEESDGDDRDAAPITALSDRAPKVTGTDLTGLPSVAHKPRKGPKNNN